MPGALKVILIGALVLASAAFARAQDAGSRAMPETTGVSVEPMAQLSRPDAGRGVWPAPVGHRQPRAADLPAAKLPPSGPDVELQLIERALDGKLRICRAC